MTMMRLLLFVLEVSMGGCENDGNAGVCDGEVWLR